MQTRMSNSKLVDQIFTQALNAPADERDQFVKQRCAGNEILAAQVFSLLTLSERPESIVEQQFDAIRNRLWQDMLAHDSEHREDLSGRLIGSWSIEKLIARGGLATVYRAQRDDGVYHQQAALKVLRRGLDTDDLITRFHAEREILSSLEHPDIANILDGGALDDGRPYLVMEYVDGLPITEHCIKNRVDIDTRVRLIIDVARAIGHAHKRLVVHRDIKPSNILVTDDGKVSVLDFGIAKLLDPLALPTNTPITRTGVSMLTPAYASPEQLASEAITTASDIYQLGLILYELLCGERPFSGDGNKGTSTLPLPSQLIKESRSRRQVQGDLDAIVHKAAHVEAELRYTSTDEFIADLNRYLDGLPILARPDSWRYRLRKLNKRKPWLLPLVGIAVIAVCSYVVTLSLYSTRLAKEQRLSVTTQEFLIDLFKAPDPFAPADAELGSSITVVDALEIGYQRVRSELPDQPALKASLLNAISEVYATLDANDIAIELRAEALEIESSVYGERSTQVVASMRALGSLYGAVGDRDKAGEYLEQQLLIATDIFNADSPELGLSQISAGYEANQLGDHEKSRSLLMSGVEKLRPQSGKYASKIISALLVTSQQYVLESKEEAMAAIAEAEDLAISSYSENSIQVASVRVRLASLLTELGDFEGSESNFLAAIPELERQLGSNHSVTLSALNNLGYLYAFNGEHYKSEQLYRQLLERQIAKNGLLHRSVGDTYQNLASTITKQGRYEESVPLHRKAYDVYKSIFNDNHYLIAFPLLSITFAELKSGNGPQAEATAREALSRFEATVPGSFLEGVAQCLIGLSLEEQGQMTEGGEIVIASHELMKTGSIPPPYPELCRLTGL